VANNTFVPSGVMQTLIKLKSNFINLLKIAVYMLKTYDFLGLGEAISVKFEQEYLLINSSKAM
jgi:hypothetical protein